MLWFKFPDNVNGISVQLHEFKTEYEDNKGRYFRTPDHFAPHILNIPGFSSVPRPDGAPEDPKDSSESDEALRRLSIELSNTKLELEDYKARLAEVSAQRDDLKLKVHELEAEMASSSADDNQEETTSSSTQSRRK